MPGKAEQAQAAATEHTEETKLAELVSQELTEMTEGRHPGAAALTVPEHVFARVARLFAAVGVVALPGVATATAVVSGSKTDEWAYGESKPDYYGPLMIAVTTMMAVWTMYFIYKARAASAAGQQDRRPTATITTTRGTMTEPAEETSEDPRDTELCQLKRRVSDLEAQLRCRVSGLEAQMTRPGGRTPSATWTSTGGERTHLYEDCHQIRRSKVRVTTVCSDCRRRHTEGEG